MNKIQACFLFALIAGLSTLTSAKRSKPASATTTRKPQSQKIAVIGGDGDNAKQVKCYDFTYPFWDLACLPEMPEGREDLGVVQIGTKLYAVGGTGQTINSENSMYILNLKTKKNKKKEWIKGRKMSTKRSLHGTAAHNGLIYAVGGVANIENKDGTVTGEVFNTTARSWSRLALMSTKRQSFSLVPVGGKLYAIGGKNYNSDDDIYVYLNSVECYDTAEKWWSTISSETKMTARSASAVAVLDDKIYVAGGSNADNSELKTFEMYDPVTNEWKPLADMTTARTSATMVAFNATLYVFGGDRLKTGETYNPEAGDSWIAFPTDFNKAIGKAASLVITAVF